MEYFQLSDCPKPRSVHPLQPLRSFGIDGEGLEMERGKTTTQATLRAISKLPDVWC